MNSTDTQAHRTAPRGLVLAAFAAIYLIWGSTYLGIRFAVETIPPFLLGGARFLLAGGVLYAWLRVRGCKLRPVCIGATPPLSADCSWGLGTAA